MDLIGIPGRPRVYESNFEYRHNISIDGHKHDQNVRIGLSEWQQYDENQNGNRKLCARNEWEQIVDKLGKTVTMRLVLNDKVETH